MQAMGFPGDSVGEESACNARDLGSIPGLGRCPGEGKGYPLQYSGLEFHGVYSSWGCKELDTLRNLKKKKKSESCKCKLWFFQQSCMDVRVGPSRSQSAEELTLLNCAGGDS